MLHIVLQRWKMNEGKRYSLYNLIFLFDIIEHLGGVQKNLIVPSPPYCIDKAYINSQCGSSFLCYNFEKQFSLYVLYAS